MLTTTTSDQHHGQQAVAAPDKAARTLGTDWKRSLPVLHGRAVTIRELKKSDAPTLVAMLATDEVARYISPPPTTVEGFERFIAWCQRERAAGRYACFGIVPEGCEHAVGVIQVRSLEPSFGVVEWGFALGVPFWGTGLFQDAARQALKFIFEVARSHRAEARASTQNRRGNGALRKLGAVQEGVLRKSFARDGELHDQYLWAITAENWKVVWSSGIH